MVVKRVEEGKVHLEKVDEDFSCTSCPLKAVCNRKDASVKVRKPDFEVQPGDEVLVEIPEGLSTKLSFFTYTLPLIVFVSVIVTFKSLGFSDLFSFLMGLLSMGGYYTALKFLDARMASKFSPRVVKRVRRNAPPHSSL